MRDPDKPESPEPQTLEELAESRLEKVRDRLLEDDETLGTGTWREMIAAHRLHMAAKKHSQSG